jgi:hypothetical protein
MCIIPYWHYYHMLSDIWQLPHLEPLMPIEYWNYCIFKVIDPFPAYFSSLKWKQTH